jgi:glycine dehydrogenase
VTDTRSPATPSPDRAPLASPSTDGGFASRHIGPRSADVDRMLATVGVDSLDDLVERIVPSGIRSTAPLALGAPTTESEALARLEDLAARNVVLTSLIGLGYHGTITPPVIARNVLEDPSWYTAYTPYQPEIAQGRLEALVNFQTMVADLTGLGIANASLLDEPTAAAEALAMCHRLVGDGRDVVVVDAACHPQTIAVVRTRLESVGLDVRVGDAAELAAAADTTLIAVLVQYPDTTGRIGDHRALADAVHAAGAMVVAATDLLALCVLTPPGEWGADVAVGSAQRFGVPMWFGGPHAGFLATAETHKRTLPGRLVGVSVDAAGRPAYRLALQTREQHIRRERATSNICTAQVLLAVVAGLYACWHGPDGLRRIATRVNHLTSTCAAALRASGLELVNDSWFDTLNVAVGDADAVLAAGVARGINLRRVDATTVGVSFDETCSPATVAAVVGAFGVDPGDLDALLAGTAPLQSVPDDLGRTSGFLNHPVFTSHHAETEMLRYLRLLSDRDVALDRAMIPLGSCTMKLNATAEMQPISWSAFADLHPFAPLGQAEGYLQMIAELERALAEVTGYDAVSLQPNAGSQGEYAGLLAIAAWHRNNGEPQRDVCLIPSSAHGTNAASAAMAGMRVVVVACDDDGNVDVADLTDKIAAHAAELSCLMVTYPSTHGVFEERIEEICGLVHDAGGQVYLDGANLNALVGVARPGHFGADVGHLNLHKTFCIPHGGGGPGVGPVGVRSHLAPFLPSSPLVAAAGPTPGVGAISGAPWGSAGILPIPWMYVTMMGAEGLTSATAHALLAANYVARRLGDHYPILYTGRDGFVAHECILDLRAITRDTGVSVDDVAKRLIDYGFHAPTMSFPVAGTLMVEPTESEPLVEIDRFCDAMIAIRDEIDRVAAGEWPAEDNPLHNAPHTAEDVTADDWSHPYPRSLAAYPVAGLRRAKYWPPVSRIDGAWGDRNLVCSCPPVEAFAESTA